MALHSEKNTVLQLILDTCPEGFWVSPTKKPEMDTYCDTVLLRFPDSL